MNEWTKSRFEEIATSYGRNEILDEIKNQEKANNSLSYLFAAKKKFQTEHCI